MKKISILLGTVTVALILNTTSAFAAYYKPGSPEAVKQKEALDNGQMVTMSAPTVEIGSSKVVAGKLTIQDKVVMTALSLKGTPYLQNGVTTKGFDASAFIQYAFKQNGVKAPRTSGELYKAVAIADQKNLMKGDLVFFDTSSNKPSKNKATFVGIYLGDNQFVAVTVSKGASVQKLTDKYWKDRFVGGGALIK